jgi:hypothetical protein
LGGVGEVEEEEGEGDEEVTEDSQAGGKEHRSRRVRQVVVVAEERQASSDEKVRFGLIWAVWVNLRQIFIEMDEVDRKLLAMERKLNLYTTSP